MTPGEFWSLSCRRCGWTRAPGSLVYACEQCSGELAVRYPRHVEDCVEPMAGPGMWRFANRLPIANPASVVSLGEGDTALVPLGNELRKQLGVSNAAVKCEHLNPTGSFKDRIAAVAATLSLERGLTGLVGTSSGNGGAAAAAYAARAGLSLTLFALSDTVAQKLLQIRAMGARVMLVDGIGHDAAATEFAAQTVARRAAENRMFPFLTGGRFSPEAMEGAKTIAYEIAEQAPGVTHVYAPVGGGGLVAALGRGFADDAELRGTSGGPRIVAVQPAGCRTLARALDGDFSGLKGACTTSISGLQVAVLFDGYGATEAVRRSGGHVTEVDDSAVWEAQRMLARSEGILVEPAGAVAFAGALADARAGVLHAEDEIVLVSTGAGYKDGNALERLTGNEVVARIGVDEIGEVLGDG
jgi:threonine synthase